MEDAAPVPSLARVPVPPLGGTEIADENRMPGPSTHVPDAEVGAEIEFDLDYGALLSAMTSPYVEKQTMERPDLVCRQILLDEPRPF